MLGDPNKQIYYAARQHWANEMSNELYSKVREIFYFQTVLSDQCMKCHETIHGFEINSIFNVRVKPEMKDKRNNLLDVIQMTLGKLMLYSKYLCV